MTTEQISKEERAIYSKARELAKGNNSNCSYDYMSIDERNRITELAVRGMVNSCMAYNKNANGVINIKTNQVGTYGWKYCERLGLERLREIVIDQCDFFKKHAKVKCNVYTDGEGVTYNSVIWD